MYVTCQMRLFIVDEVHCWYGPQFGNVCKPIVLLTATGAMFGIILARCPPSLPGGAGPDGTVQLQGRASLHLRQLCNASEHVVTERWGSSRVVLILVNLFLFLQF